jgi:hypothetical protein
MATSRGNRNAIADIWTHDATGFNVHDVAMAVLEELSNLYIHINAKEHDYEKPSCLARNCMVSTLNNAAFEVSLRVYFKKKPIRLKASPLIKVD